MACGGLESPVGRDTTARVDTGEDVVVPGSLRDVFGTALGRVSDFSEEQKS